MAAAHAAALSPEARAKKAKTLTGPSNPMYGRVGASNPAFSTGEYAGTSEYRRHRGDACADCGATSSATRGLVVHHDDGNHYNNDPANLVTLCDSCHPKRHAQMRRSLA